MAQITLYLDEEIAQKMRQAAREEGVSQSRWVADLIKKKICDEWPSSVIELAGAWPDYPDAETLRASETKDTARESL